MKPFPHYYEVTVTAGEKNSACITSPGLNTLDSAPPAEFGGPGTLWSPETLMVAAVADCFVFTFRAIAAASKFTWTDIECEAGGSVDRVEGLTRFTALELRVRLQLPAGADREKAKRLAEKAEKSCVVGNSLRFAPTLSLDIAFTGEALAPTA